MKKILILALLLFQLIVAGIASAAPNIPARPTGTNYYVLDQANIISSADEQRIYNFAKAIENKTTAQIAVLTVKSLDGYSIDDYALAVLRSWGIGQKEQNNGVLILVAPNERRSRIEVGYGLEGVLTDGRTGRIQDTYMLPFFRRGNYSTGIMVGTAAVASSIDHGGPIGAQVQNDTNTERPEGDYSKIDALNKEMGIPSSGEASLASYDQIIAQADKLLANTSTAQSKTSSSSLNQSANSSQTSQNGDAQANAQSGTQSQGLSLLEMLIIAGILIIDWVFLGGFITRTIFYMLLFRGGGGGRRGGGGGFGGGSGGGGGSSRSW